MKLTKIKDKEKILRATRKKQQITYKGISMRLSADFLAETLQARREWRDIFKIMKTKNLTIKITLPGKDLIQTTKSFTDKQKLREFSTTKQALQQMLKELL